MEDRFRQLDGPQAEGGELEPHEPSRGPYGLPKWSIYGGPDMEVAALLGRTDEATALCGQGEGKGRATGPGNVMDIPR